MSHQDAREQTLPEPMLHQHVQQLQRGAGPLQTMPDAVLDWVAAEVPVALVFNGISHAVMMATPQDLEDFALGFALSEGLIDSPADCRGMEVRSVSTTQWPDWPAATEACEVELEIASHCMARLKAKRRALAGRTGCGVCGIDSLQGLDLQPELVRAPAWLAALSVDQVLNAFDALPTRQPLNQHSGAVHAAGWATADGQLRDVLEDVGRHNALDKLIGRLARTGKLDFSQAKPGTAEAAAVKAGSAQGFVLMSSRASYELVRKCARMQIPALAAISAPTSLAIAMARQAGMQLWGFCRDPRALRYV